MKSMILLFLTLSTGCAAQFVQQDKADPMTYTVGREAGLWTEAYTVAYKNQAQELCPSGYKVLDKSWKPKTLEKVGVKKAEGVWYWVIKCL